MIEGTWLGGRDSNPDKQIQSLFKTLDSTLFGRPPPGNPTFILYVYGFTSRCLDPLSAAVTQKVTQKAGAHDLLKVALNGEYIGRHQITSIIKCCSHIYITGGFTTSIQRDSPVGGDALSRLKIIFATQPKTVRNVF